MANERFTDLPNAPSAQMDDIICAVQGYVSPSVLGLSVQENLGQIYTLFKNNIILNNSGNPNGTLAGTINQLCWDTVNRMLWICVSTGTSMTAIWNKVIKLTAGSGIVIDQADSEIIISTNATAFPWNLVSGTEIVMSSNNGYSPRNSGLTSLFLPTTSSFGDVIHILGYGAGGWQISQNDGQQVIVGDKSSTPGFGGGIGSTNQFDSITLVCQEEDSIWQALGAPQGNITYV